MITESDFRPKVGPSNPYDKPHDWLSTTQTITTVRNSRHAYEGDLIQRAADGKQRTWASLLVVGETKWRDAELPALFWRQWGPNMQQNWVTGDFAVIVQRRFQVSAFGVVFHRGDLAANYPKLFRPEPEAIPKETRRRASAATKTSPTAKGGRSMSACWPDWVAELTAYVHEHGIPDGDGTGSADVLIKTIADRLAARGLESPSRTTTQATIRAVLLRLRDTTN